jgi:hypothetical protein
MFFLGLSLELYTYDRPLRGAGALEDAEKVDALLVRISVEL